MPGETVAEYLSRRTGATDATAAMEATATALGSGEPGAEEAYAVAFDHWMASGAPDLDERIPSMLAELGLDAGGHALMTSLSGGQAARAALAALLLSRFDLVLLDEPTNDLDLAGLERLESFVRGLRGGVVLVSHDREFLARCVTGSSSWTSRRTACRSTTVATTPSSRNARWRAGTRARRTTTSPARRPTWSRAPGCSASGARRASGTPSRSPDNDKIRRKAAVESSEKQAQKVRQMESRIARLDEVEPRKEWVLQFTIGSAPRSSSVVSTLNEATLRLGDFGSGPRRSRSTRGTGSGSRGPTAQERPPCCGCCSGAVRRTPAPPASGRRSRSAGSTRRGPDWPRSCPGDAVEAALPDLPPAEIRTLLAKFGLKADQVTSPVARLSPGERTRAALALLQARG